MKIKTLLLLSILLGTSFISWGQYIMMTVNGVQQGKFKAESSRSGYSDKTELLGYEMEVKSGRDAASGQATGRRQYMPITIWKNSGASSPQFLQALSRNEPIKELKLEFYKPDDVFKREALFYTVELVNARIVGYRQIMGTPDSSAFKAKSNGFYDEISIVFEKITVTDTKGNISTADDWNKTNQ